MTSRTTGVPDVDDEVDQPVTKADWGAMTSAERAAIQAAVDQLDRGEGVPHSRVFAELQRIRERRAR